MANWEYQWEIPASAGNGKTYTVSHDSSAATETDLGAWDPQWACDCPAWTRGRKKWGDCKHIKMVKFLRKESDLPAVSGISVANTDDIPVTFKGRRKINRRMDVVESVEG
jgi:hypothetical protein